MTEDEAMSVARTAFQQYAAPYSDTLSAQRERFCLSWGKEAQEWSFSVCVLPKAKVSPADYPPKNRDGTVTIIDDRPECLSKAWITIRVSSKDKIEVTEENDLAELLGREYEQESH
jgi:hypothetical protein